MEDENTMATDPPAETPTPPKPSRKTKLTKAERIEDVLASTVFSHAGRLAIRSNQPTMTAKSLAAEIAKALK